MPKVEIPPWLMSNLGLGVANAIAYSYRSYGRMGHSVKARIKSWKIGILNYTKLAPRSTPHPPAVQNGEQRSNGVRIRIRSDSMSEGTQTPDTVITESRSLSSLLGDSSHTADAGMATYDTSFGRPSKAVIDAQAKKLIESAGVALFFLKPEPKTNNRIIHIYNNQGEKVYVLLRPDSRSQTWTLAYADAQSGRGDLATVYAGKKDGRATGTGVIAARAHPGKYVLFNNTSGGLTYRKVSRQWTPEDGNMRTFYLFGAEPYHWTKAGFLQRSVFPVADFFMTDPAVGTPATLPLGVFRNDNSMQAWCGQGIPAYYSPTEGRARDLAASSRASALTDRLPTPTSTALANIVDQSGIERRTPRETIAYAARIEKDMTWAFAIDTSKISPEVAIATGWIGILHLFSNTIVSTIKMPKLSR
ncbi:hypothetical protein V1512DRAFT_48534 [Lipomyces arxii]|uniref:uncharacterized protein n=1 Tax=Lipomyces arxii TaxID=56418 RepID=UPI0034CE0A2F